MDLLGVLLPVFLLILLGQLLLRIGFPGDGFWSGAERLIYFLMFPCLLFTSIVARPLAVEDLLRLGAVALGALALSSLLLLALRPLLSTGPAAFTSVYQGGIRFNTYVGLAVASAWQGTPGLAVAAVLIALMVPTLNLLSVAVLTYFAGQPGRRGRLYASQLLRNPLILACVAGLLVNLTGLPLPGQLLTSAEFLGRAALPLGLLAVGAGLGWRWSAGDAAALAASSLVKLLLMPLLVWALASWLALSPLQTRVAVLFAALPTATAAYLLARQLGGDHRLMAALISAQTLLAAITLPWVLSWVG